MNALQIKKLLLVWPIFVFSFSPLVFGQYEITLIDYTTNIKVELQTKRAEVSLTYQIENEQSSWISDFEIPYSDDGNLRIESAEIIDRNGIVVRRLKKKDILTVSNRSNNAFYWDRYIKQFDLKWHEYPYRIKIKYTTSTRDFLDVARWSPYKYTGLPVETATLTVQLPQNYNVSIDYPQAVEMDSFMVDNNIKLRWQFDDLPYIKSQVYSEPVTELIPWIRVIPHEFNFSSKGSLSSWKDYGNWQYEINKDLLELTLDEQKTIDELIINAKTDQEKIKILYYYMQDNTRYINVSIDEGGLIPYPASYVCDNKYGDCKALTIYMMALLKYIGIESNYIDVLAGQKPVTIIEDLPSQQFNHVILAVPTPEDTIWLENTSKILPFNHLGNFTENRKALIIDQNNSRLINTPKSKHTVLKTEESHFHLNENGSGSLVRNITLRGNRFVQLKDAMLNLNSQDQLKYLRSKFSRNKATLDAYTVIPSNRDSAVIDLKLEYELQNSLRKIANKVLLSLPGLDFPRFEKPSDRTENVRFYNRIEESETLVYSIENMTNHEIKLPENVNVTTKYGNYRTTYEIRENSIIAKRTFVIPQQTILIDDYINFYSFIESLKESWSQKIIFTTG